MSLYRSITTNPNFTVLDETKDFIVVNKPAPLLVHPSVPGNPPTLLCGLQSLLAFELANGAGLSIINRLDRETSGLVLVAKNLPTARAFHKVMERRQAEKEYLAICWGWPEQDHFTVEAPLRRAGEFRDSPIWLLQAVHPEGASALTEFSVEKRFRKQTSNGEKFSLIRAHPHTGRMHQIRVHLQSAGFSVVGDKLYGPSAELYLEHIETGWTEALAERLLLPRHALHSCKLSLPWQDRHYTWDAPLWEDLAAFAFADEPDSATNMAVPQN